MQGGRQDQSAGVDGFRQQLGEGTQFGGGAVAGGAGDAFEAHAGAAVKHALEAPGAGQFVDASAGVPVVFAELAGQGRIAGGHLPQGDPFVGGRNRHPPVGHRRAVVQEASVRAGGDQQRPAVARQRGQCPLFAGGRLQAAHRHPPAQFQPASEAGRCVAADEGGFATQRFGEDPGDGPRLPRVAAADRQGLRIAGQRGGVTRGLRQQGRWQRRRITQPDLYAGPAGGQVGQCEGHRRRGAQGGFGQRTAFAFEQQQAAVACRAGDQGRQVMFGGATVEAGGKGHDEARGGAGAAGRAL